MAKNNGEATLWLKIKTAGEEALDKTAAAISKIGQVGAVAFAALSAIVVKSIADFREQETATKALTQSMINNGIYSAELKEKYIAQASALQKLTTFGDEQIIAAQAAVQAQVGQLEVTEELTKSILDFATAQKMDAASAAELIGKSIGTSTNALGRYGIEVDSAADKSTKMAQVIQGLNSKFGGQAAAAASGLGALDQLKNVASDLFETLGERLAPSIGLMANQFKTFLTTSPLVTTAIDAIVGGFQFMYKGAYSVIATFDRLGSTIGAVFGTVAGTIDLLMRGQFRAALDAINTGMDEVGQMRVQKQQEYNQKMLEIDAAFNEQKKVQQEQEVKDLEETLRRKKEIAAIDAEEKLVKQAEDHLLMQEQELAMIAATDEQKLQLQIDAQKKKLEAATTAEQKLAIMKNLSRLTEEKRQMAHNAATIEMERKKWEAISGITGFAAGAITNIMGKESGAAFLAQKAAAIAAAIVSTNQAAAQALTLGPIAGPPMAAVIKGLGYANVAAIASQGIKLAEGGIVKARPGGIQATIGEGGQDEAVIPLDKMGAMGGSSYTINVYGGLLGDETSAYKLAQALDQELYKLRKNNESVAFDKGVV